MSRLVDGYINEIFKEKNVSPENQEKLWKFYNDKLSKGVDVGWNDGFEIDDKPLVNSLKKSIAEFSAFKETAFRKDLEDLLIKDGKLTPWSEFKKEAMKVSGDYNAKWLETEYHQTVANANMAAKWKDFENNVDLYPNVKLVSVRDARVRPEHKVLDGTIRPYNDPFWNIYTPPLDWGCRCHVEQTDEEPTEVKGGIQTKIEFENNPATSGKIFGGSGYESRITVEEATEAKRNAGKWLIKANMQADDKRIFADKRRKEYLEILKPILNKNVIRFVGNNKSIKIGHQTKGLKHIVDDVLYKTSGLNKKDLPKLHDFLKEAEFIRSSDLVKDRADDIVRFYYFKDREKNIYYNVAETAKKTKNGKVKIDRFLYSVTNSILEK